MKYKKGTRRLASRGSVMKMVVTERLNKYLQEDVTIEEIQEIALVEFMTKLGYPHFRLGCFETAKPKTCSQRISLNTAVKIYNGKCEVIPDDEIIERIIKGGLSWDMIYFNNLNFNFDPKDFFVAWYSKLTNKVCMQYSKKKGEIIFSNSKNVKLISDYLKLKYRIVDDKND